ncbi:MAG: Hsp70 family protein [Rhodococcus sp. (in: high G+C Gram-positive bacteria)]|uniref:Hsp70 family protein n=1 Tax=Rhodococcus sp. TaxID=1831 RepID=UPI003BB6B1F5
MIERGVMGGWALSIDFGTSNTAAAHTSAVSGRIETLSLTHHGNLLPSSVAVGAGQTVLTGAAAAAEADRNPGAFVTSPKRLVGQVPSVRVGDTDVPVDALISGVLATVLDRALAAHNRQMPDRVVLTHPEGWSPSQVAVLVAAAARAGIDPRTVTTVSEPRAAAHHYSRATSAVQGTRLAVFDFGGGTLDVAVLTATGTGTFEVVAARGDNSLGGKNFDARLHRWLEAALAENDSEAVDALRHAPAHVQRAVDEQVRRAKELLSESPSASISVDIGRHRRTVSITRAEYERLIAGDIDRAAALARAAFADAGVAPGDLAALYLTGGSAGTPLVHTRIGQLGPIATLDDPKTVVAQGALLAAGGVPVADRRDTAVLERPAAPPLPPQPSVFPVPVEPAPRSGARKTWMVVTTVAAVVLVVAGAAAAVVWSTSGGSVADAGAAASNVTSTSSPRADGPPGATTTAVPVLKSTPRGLPPTDILRVGTHIEPGEYAVRPLDSSGGYWERLSCLNGDVDCIVANDVVEGNGYVRIHPDDLALGVRNLELTPITNATTPPATSTTRPRATPPAAAPTLVGTDSQGFVDVPQARCNHTNPAIALGRTTDSLVVVCETGVGRLYYRGVRLDDGAGIEIDDPSATGSGYTATNDDVQYQISASSLIISDGATVLAEESMLEYWAR